MNRSENRSVVRSVTRSSGADPCSIMGGGGGGYNLAFLPFFRILKFWGEYSGFFDFSSYKDFENLGLYPDFNENILKQLKTRIRRHKIDKLCVHNEHVYSLQFLNS